MRIKLLLAKLLLALSLHAQEKLFEEPIGWRSDDIELHTISDSAGRQSCLFLCKEDSIRAFVLDDKQAVVQHFYFRRLEQEQFFGGFIKEGAVHVFLEAYRSSQGMHVRTLHIADGTSQDETVSFDTRHERAVDRISCGNHFLFLAANKKTSVFSIYDFHDNKPGDTLRYHFDGAFWHALTVWIGPGLVDMNVVVIDSNDRMNPALARVSNKLYWIRDTLFLVMNRYEKGVTDIYSFSMRSKRVDFRQIVHNNIRIWEPPVERYTDNSMLLDDKLYFVSALDTQLNVQVRDFHSGKRLASYVVHPGEPLLIANTPIFELESNHNPQVVKRVDGLISLMLARSALVMIDRADSGRVEMSIGAYQLLNSGPGGVAVPTWYGVLSATMVALLVPSRTTALYSGFKMVLDSATAQQVQGNPAPAIEDRVGQSIIETGISPLAERLFTNGGRRLFAYYSKKERKLVVLGF